MVASGHTCGMRTRFCPPSGNLRLSLLARRTLPLGVSPVTSGLRYAATGCGRTRGSTLASPLIHENFEGIAATREGAATIIWIVSDDNQLWLQRSLLLKFRLEA